MTDLATLDPYGVLTEPATLKIQRLLPGPIERVWAYLTESDLRRQWLASGQMEMKVGAPVELVWHNAEHRMQSHITELDPPHKLAITWGSTGGVSFELEPKGNEVLLTLIHHRVSDPAILLNVSTGWHAHLDILVARATGKEPEPFWDGLSRLRKEYERRMSA